MCNNGNFSKFFFNATGDLKLYNLLNHMVIIGPKHLIKYKVKSAAVLQYKKFTYMI